MGFRNPVSTVSDVNTGDPLSGAGAHLYETTDANGYPYGVLDFPDGVTGDVSPKVIGKADYNPRAQAQVTGGGLRLQGGSYNPNGAGLIAAPEVDLLVVQNGDGSHTPVVSMTAGTGGKITQDVATAPLIAATALPLNGAFFQPYNPGTGWSQPTYRKLASGLVVVSGLIGVINASFTVGTVIATLPVGCRPAGGSMPFFCVAWSNNAGLRADVQNNGTITYQGSLPSATPTAGAFIALDGIAFVAEQ